ncbi:phosphotransferase [Henriciella litoralis]|uniref:phosphotransferase n=1 Tax=Henriciella litoralis TaxID=568102 RepID=UPI00146B6A07|nr:phosphotransferase [Henriciella litoralis]
MIYQPDIFLIRSLVKSSFPDLADADIRLVRSGGTDNYVFRIDNDLCLRIAKRDAALPSLLQREPVALKTLSDLPLETPRFMAKGVLPDPRGWPWMICTWLHGVSMDAAGHTATIEDANRLALFLLDLQGCPTRNAAKPAPDNHWRGVDLIQRNTVTEDAITTLSDEFDATALARVWSTALTADPCRPDDRTWIHGDLHPANLVVRDGAVTGVLDWGLSGLGDPACDLMAAYTVFSGQARDAFARATAASESVWMRARGWALSTAVVALAYYRGSDAPIVARSREVIGEILAEAS